jgi:septal ring factor EnvC (AmiA/AmiB activator)
VEITILIFQAVILVTILASIRFFKRYVQSKANDFATKQDIREIAQNIESVKAEIKSVNSDTESFKADIKSLKTVIDSVRAESAREQRIELAEDVLGLFYEAGEAIAAIRSGLDSDAKESPTGLVDTVKKRLKQRAEIFDELESMKARFITRFGPEQAEPFEQIRQVLRDIRDAVIRLNEFETAHGQAYDEEESEQLISNMKKYEAILRSGYEDVDEMSKIVDNAIWQMEETCNRLAVRK